MNGNNLLRAIQMYDFYLYELNLYLDTHPADKQALEAFRRTREQRNIARDAYVKNVDPITADQTFALEYFTWVDNSPWPWERSAN